MNYSKYNNKQILVEILRELKELNNKLIWGKVEEIQPTKPITEEPAKPIKKR